MRNLLQGKLSETALARILSSASREPVLPSMSSDTWRRVASNAMIGEWMVSLKEQAVRDSADTTPVLTEESYREFHKTGGRAAFESAYFERRRRLARATMCAALADETERAQWVSSVEETAEEILSELAWALPAHVGQVSGQDPLLIDVAGAGTANLMAETVAVLGEALPERLVARVRDRLRVQFFDSYIGRHEEFWWTKSAGEWNAVCHQGVLGAALTLEQDADIVARMLGIAENYLPIYLRGFESDGVCSEGPGYWQYGFGAFSILNEQLEKRTAGELSLFEGDDRVGEIARYGLRVSLAGYHFVNFSDSPRSGALNPALLMYLGRRLDDARLRACSYRNYQRLQQAGITPQGQHLDLFYPARLFLGVPFDHTDAQPVEWEDVFFRDHGMIVAHGHDLRGNLWEFAAKAGHNAEHHNHNDCGSYLLNINGAPLIVEIGAPAYTKDYFGHGRYHYLAARTLGHSLPIVNGCEQAAGPQYASSVLGYELGEEQVEFSVDLTACYPREAGCNELTRNFFLDKRAGQLHVKDFYDLEKEESFETSILTEDAVKTERDRLAVIVTDNCSLVVTPFDGSVIVAVEAHEYRDHAGLTRKINRIILRPEQLGKVRFVGYKLKLAE